MRFLKNKIARAMQLAEANNRIPAKVESWDSAPHFVKLEQGISIKSEEPIYVKTEVFPMKTVQKSSPKSSPVAVPVRRPKRESKINKNIIKNYARAMVNFAQSEVAAPYLAEELKAEPNVNLQGFLLFMESQKDEITSIRRLRELLLINEVEDERIASFKRIFQAVSLVFIRDFSVNWIYNSKISDKLTHTKYRFKIFRRVQNPECFTYLEDFSRK